MNVIIFEYKATLVSDYVIKLHDDYDDYSFYLDISSRR